MDTLSSFSNQCGGGIVLFGIDESKDFEVYGVYDAADLQRKIAEQCLQMEPEVKDFKKRLAVVKPNMASLDQHRIFQLLGFVAGANPTVTGLFMFAAYPQAN